jgi:HEAT repeat protein
MRIIVVAVAVMACGCHKSTPTLAGGKPVSHWVEALKSPDPKLRKEAAFKLGNVGSTDRTAFPALVDALKDPDPVVRRECILALVKFGDERKQAVPALAEIHERDSDPHVREYAAKALEKMK